MNQRIKLILLLFVFGSVSKILCQNSSSPKSLWEQELETRDTTRPINFGHKWVWAAVKTQNTDSLLEILKLERLRQANWVEGTLQAYYGEVFILPPIEGWILISGWGLPKPSGKEGIEKSKSLLDKLSKQFGEAQLYGNHGLSSSAFWMKSVDGKTVRLYCIADGENFIEGEPTDVEKKWSLIDTNSEEAVKEEYWDRMVYPDVEHVLEVAKNWSINPMELEEKANIGAFGHLGQIRRK
jgi:hypothetical protein